MYSLAGQATHSLSSTLYLAQFFTNVRVTHSTQGVTHISLRNTRDALIACAKYGRDFQNLTAVQIVLALRVYAAQRIQAQWRGWGPRCRFAPKMVSLRTVVRREREFRKVRRAGAFGAWSTEHRRRIEFLRGTRRSFHRWRVLTVRLTKVASLFRGTFWPLYVWRRWANHRISSTDKVSCVLQCYTLVSRNSLF